MGVYKWEPMSRYKSKESASSTLGSRCSVATCNSCNTDKPTLNAGANYLVTWTIIIVYSRIVVRIKAKNTRIRFGYGTICCHLS